MQAVNLQMELSDMQGWLLLSFLSEVEYSYVLEKTDGHLPAHERASNARATMRAIRALHNAIMMQGGYKPPPV